MADKKALRELQNRLSERLQATRTQEQGKSWLAVQCRSIGFLFPLKEAGEIFPMSPVLSVPYSCSWFLGVSNLRGSLYGVVDLAAFLGINPSESGREQSRLVTFNTTLEINCALLVDRLCGLRGEGQLTEMTDFETVSKPLFAGLRYRDESGSLWQELSLSTLAKNASFLRIVQEQR